MQEFHKKVLIRVDGSSSIGLGHLIRCLALAQMIKDDFEISFICREIPDKIVAELKENGFTCEIIDNEEVFFRQIQSNCIVVIDGYHFNMSYQLKLKATGAKLVCIDDMHEKEFVADLIINHGPGTTPQDYKTKPYTQFALGIDYALLRPLFLHQAKKQRTIKIIETIMICFGGSDFKNLTQSTLSVVMQFSQFRKIIVITGAAYQASNSFKQLVKSDKRIDHRHALKEQQMLDSMLESDLTIVPSSAILFEVLAAGCIAISGIYIDNQRLVFEKFREAKYFVDAGTFMTPRLNIAISEALKYCNYEMKFIDGNSGIRISKLFDQLRKELLINIRRLTITDLDITFVWATDPEVRRFSFQQHRITKKEHKNWLIKKTMSSDCYYFIVEFKENPIGSIRFDMKDSEASISYLLDSSYHGQGFGQLILKKGIEELLNLTRAEQAQVRVLRGEVMKMNIPSVKSFERLGFVKNEKKENYEFEKWVS